MSIDEATAPAAAPSRRIRGFLLAGLAVALLLAGVVSFYASQEPDGLEKVSAEHSLDAHAQDHQLSDSPLAGYEVRGVDSPRLSVGAAGVVGVAVTFAVAGGLFLLVRRSGRDRADGTTADETSA